MKRIAIIVAGLALLVTAGVALMQSSENFALPWHVIAGGGQRSLSPGFQVVGTAGQAIASPPGSAGASFRVGSGYWAGIHGSFPPFDHWIYLPVIQRGPN
jgi:hypothetical protein